VAAGHGTEAVLFLDGNGAPNNFEGVATYKGRALYAIGDDVFDKFPDPNDNASTYFAERVVSSGIRRAITNMDKGLFKLIFSNPSSFVDCDNPYAGKTAKQFRWHD
jgi:hypothetical protein